MAAIKFLQNKNTSFVQCHKEYYSFFGILSENRNHLNLFNTGPIIIKLNECKITFKILFILEKYIKINKAFTGKKTRKKEKMVF